MNKIIIPAPLKKIKEDFDVDLYELSVELFKLKALASCLEDKLIKATIAMNEEGENVFCLVDLLQEHISLLIDNASSLEEEAV